MKKKLLALSIGAALTAATVPAMSAELKISGRAHVSVDHYDNGASKDGSGMDVSSNSSRLRFSGKHEVAEGLTAMMQLESAINFDRRQQQRGKVEVDSTEYSFDTTRGDTFTTRDSFVGLKGNFGMVRLGYFDTPTKKVRSRTDMFGDRIGDARNITGGDFDQRFHNSIHYQSPSFSGLTFDLQYSGDNRDESGDQKDFSDDQRDSYSTSLTYKAGNLLAIAAYENQGQGTKDDKTAYRLGATYNVMKGLRVAGFFEDANEDSNDNEVFGVGAYYDLNSDYRLRGQYYMATESSKKDDGASMFVVGLDRKFGKALTLYGVYAATDNDKNATFSASAGGHGTDAGATKGKTTSAFSLGAIYNF